MARLEPLRLAEPISDDEVCGPDLEAAFDADFHNFTAFSAGLLPATFFRIDDQGRSDAFTFKRGDTDVEAAFESIAALSERTRDLRLAVRQGKLLALGRDVDGFAALLAGVAQALDERWDGIHPQAEDGDDYFMRMQSVQALDDPPHVILPLQHATLTEGARGGAFSYRTWLIASGKLAARPGEPTPDLSVVERAFNDADLDALIASRALYVGIVASVERIEAVSAAKGGFEHQIKLDKLKALATEISEFLDATVARRAPSRALRSQPAAGTATTTPAAGSSPAAAVVVAVLKDRPEAVRTLRGACLYFERFEPSSPVVLLLRFAESLMGRPFYEVMRVMMPDYAGRAAVQVGHNAFRLVVERLAETIEPREPELAKADKTPPPDVKTRPEALALLDSVAAFLKTTEPANPIPLVLARVRDLAEQDFVSLVRDLFSDSSLRSMREQD